MRKLDAKQFLDQYGYAEAERVAIEAGTTIGYFKHIAFGRRNASPPLATALAEASGGRLDKMKLMMATPDRQGLAS